VICLGGLSVTGVPKGECWQHDEQMSILYMPHVVNIYANAVLEVAYLSVDYSFDTSCQSLPVRSDRL
jgi:hypothetical protein